MKDRYPRYRSEGIRDQHIYSSLSDSEKQIVDDFLNFCSITAGERRLKDIQTNILQFRDILEKPFDAISLLDLREFLAVLNKSDRMK